MLDINESDVDDTYGSWVKAYILFFELIK